MNYYSACNKLSVISFGKNFSESQLLFEEEIERKIELDPEITILSDCDNMSFLSKQCTFNNIKICKLDMKNILGILNNIQTKYVLLVVGDAMLLDGLDRLKRYDFLMCGNNEPNSKYFPVNNNFEFLFAGVNKYANQNMIFARRTKMIEFFEDFFEYCFKELKIINPYSIKNTNAIFNLWYSKGFKNYDIDSRMMYMTTLTKSNYNVREEEKCGELVRFVIPNNFHEKEFRLF